MNNRKIQLRLYPTGIVSGKWYLQYRVDPTELKWYQKIFSGGWSRVCGLLEYDRIIIYFTYSGDNPEEYLKQLQTHIKSENDLDLWVAQEIETYEKSHPNTRIIY